jgi:choline dehydrogenase
MATGGSVDVLVCGAGSAGAALAGRLSEDPARHVLALEGGRNYRSAEAIDAIRAVAMSPSLDYNAIPDYYWMELRAARSRAQPQEFYWRGKGVGGSSAINGQVAIRPDLAQFDRWEADGCTGWSTTAVLPHFARLEDDVMYGGQPGHGRGGPIPVQRAAEDEWSTLELAYRDAAAAAGHAWIPDLNLGRGSGTSWYPYNARDGARVSTNDGYLEPARGRPNLTVRGGVTVDRVLFEGTRATGVRVIGAEGVEDLFADEVILSAGSIGSAAILLRSGVGPADELRALDVPVVVDLPVGRALQDHAGISYYFPMREPGRPGLYRPLVATRWSSSVVPDAHANDMFMLASGPLGPTQPTGLLIGWLNEPLSRGSLHLASTDPGATPRIELDLLSDPRDVARLYEARDQLAAVAAHPDVRAVQAGPPTAADTTTLAAACSMDEAEFTAWAPSVVRDTAHVSGTCRMGRPDDPRTVVDVDCAVVGLVGLRVVDASIFPSIPTANTNLTTIMAAEKVAAKESGNQAV